MCHPCAHYIIIVGNKGNRQQGLTLTTGCREMAISMRELALQVAQYCILFIIKNVIAASRISNLQESHQG